MFRHSKFLVQYAIFAFRIWLRPDAAPGLEWVVVRLDGANHALSRFATQQKVPADLLRSSSAYAEPRRWTDTFQVKSV